MSIRLIGITGKAGAGKDTVADYLKAVANFKAVAFATPIRSALKAIFGFEDALFMHPYKEVVLEEYGKSPRQMMQTLGTDWARNLVNRDLWLILAGKKAADYHRLGYNVAITDLRFENEAEYIRKIGGVVWHVDRQSAGTPHAHASEAGVAYVDGDVRIDNNSTIARLYEQVDYQLSILKETK